MKATGNTGHQGTDLRLRNRRNQLVKRRQGFILYLSLVISSSLPHRMIPSQSLVKGCENFRPKAKEFVSSLLESYDLAEVSS